MKKNYQITIGYKAVITVDVKAADEIKAKELAMKNFNKERERWFKVSGVLLQDDTYKADGIVDMSNTWDNL